MLANQNTRRNPMTTKRIQPAPTHVIEPDHVAEVVAIAPTRQTDDEWWAEHQAQQRAARAADGLTDHQRTIRAMRKTNETLARIEAQHVAGGICKVESDATVLTFKAGGNRG
ncbi:MAG: hypothetical protein Q7V88_09200 [Actinomycetota bacterium]|nr:hypothetical protein [Actinomycetota bacterium]